MSDETLSSRCGTVALLGRPNVGKSTLLNALLGVHLSIVSAKPQTTRHRILGILTRAAGQILFLDTPGMHAATGKALNRRLNRAVRSVLGEADVLVQLVEAGQWRDEDEAVYQAMSEQSAPRLLAINKVDLKRDKREMLPWVQTLAADHDFADIFYVSARRREGLEVLEAGILERLPEGEPQFAEDELTDRSERFLVAEMVREQLMLRLQQELPYATTVQVERFERREGGALVVDAVIWVEREGQKAIVIGKGGKTLKLVGSQARKQIEELLGAHVHLGLWVKVRQGWSNDESALQRFGIT